MRSIRSGFVALFASLAIGSLMFAQAPSNPTADRGYIGILVSPAQNGVMVNEVTPDSPAAKSGLRKGDRVVKFANNDVKDIDAFLQAVAAKKPGDKMAVAVNRDGKDVDVTITVGKWPIVQNNLPSIEPLDRPRRVLLGVETEPMTPALKKRLNVETDAGAVVIEVMPNSPAAKAGLKADDVITNIDQGSVNSPIDLSNEVQKIGAGKDVEIKVLRGKEKLTLKAHLQAPSGAPPLATAITPFRTTGRNASDMENQIRELERRVNDLEKRLHDLEKK